MKLKYLVPFLLFFAPKNLEAQFKAEANSDSLDVKSKYLDVSLGNSFGLENLVNTRGEIKLKYGDNSVYGIRNGILNHSYGGTISLGFIGGFQNQSMQSNRAENRVVQDSPIGEIITETTILRERRLIDFGIILRHRGVFVNYESSELRNNVNGSTIITIGEDENLVPFSSESRSESVVYGAGFRNGFLKFIQNRHQEREDGENQPEEEFDNYFANANYSFGGEERNRVNLNIYYSKDFAGLLNFNFFRDLDLNLTYDSNSDRLRVNLSTSRYSELHRRDFERGIEDRLRAVPRVYDSNLETMRRYLGDMFFTSPMSYSFTLDEEGLTANLNLNHILFHYSRDNQSIGLRGGFLIGTYDFKQDVARFGIFFNGRRSPQNPGR